MDTYHAADDDLAAAIFYLLGEPVPNKHSRLDDAKRLESEIGDREELLRKIVELCGTQETPKQLYLATRAYSWLGKGHYEDTVRCATAYLNTDGWKELPGSTKMENGVRVDYASVNRASILVDLARAQQGLGKLDAALSNFMEAFRITPFSAMNAIKAADVLAKLHGKEEALLFLMQQKKSKYYTPVKYTDLQGHVRKNEVFKQLLDAHILKLQEKETIGW